MFGRYKAQLKREQERLEEKHRILVETEKRLQLALEHRDDALAYAREATKDADEADELVNRMSVRLALIARMVQEDVSFLVIGVQGEEVFTGIEIRNLNDLNDIVANASKNLTNIVQEAAEAYGIDLQQLEDEEAEEARVRDGA